MLKIIRSSRLNYLEKCCKKKMRRVFEVVDIPMNWQELLDKYKPLPWEDRRDFEHKWMTLWYTPFSFVNSAAGGAPCKRIYCNKDLVDDLDEIFNTIIVEKLNDEINTYDGCFNVRRIRKSKSGRWSIHSFGLAVDFNASENSLGAEPKMNKRIVEIFKNQGWAWGGDFKRKDGMHFQRVHNC